MNDLAEWLLAQIAEDERVLADFMQSQHYEQLPDFYWSRPEGHKVRNRDDDPGEDLICLDMSRFKSECEAKRRIVERHKSWPVLVETPPTLSPEPGNDLASTTFRMSQQIAWLTEQEYRNRFGTEPPTSPILRLLALPYADRPGYLEEWAA